MSARGMSGARVARRGRMAQSESATSHAARSHRARITVPTGCAVLFGSRVTTGGGGGRGDGCDEWGDAPKNAEGFPQ